MNPTFQLCLLGCPARRDATLAGPLQCADLPAQTATGPDGSASQRGASAEAHAPTLRR